MVFGTAAAQLAASSTPIPGTDQSKSAALVPIITEAGGTFTSLDGAPGPWGGNALATNGHLHDAVLSFLGTSATLGDPDEPTTGPGTVTQLRGRHE